ncbi:MAG: YbjN domain-containing protein [Candidatus Puniceispirillales bacterium]
MPQNIVFYIPQPLMEDCLKERFLMQVIVPTQSAPLAHPIELMERFVAANEWRLHHASPTEISVEIPGQWSDYTLNLTWQGKHAALHLNVFLDIFILDSQITAAREVVTTMNSQIWMGHFDLLVEDGSVVFRHNLPLRGTGGATPEQIEDLIDITIGECERAYPALFQIATGVVSAQDAVETAFMETAGTA